MDQGHIETEKLLVALERKIKKIYGDASKEMKKEADRYFATFIERDKKQQELLKAGKITEQEYKNWRLAQLGRGEQFIALRDDLAKRMTEANKVAASYINDDTPGIYSLNHNYAAYEIEQVAGNVGFTLYDEQTVKRLIADDPTLLPKRRIDAPKDLKWNKKRFTSEITAGILQGESIGKIANRVQNLSDANRAGAIRNARTAVTGAQNAGRQASYNRAKEMGLPLRKRWIATKDNRTRHAHAMLDGQTVALDESFKIEGSELMFPGDPAGRGYLVWNCRCTMRTVEKEGIEAEPRQMRVRNPETGRNELVSEMTYAEWAGWKTATQPTDSGFKKVKVQKAMAEKQEETPQGFTPASSAKELNQRLSTATGTSVDFSAMDLKLANEYLEGFESFYDEYPALRGFVGRVDTKVPKGLTGAYDRKTTYTRDYRHSVSNSVSLTSQYSEGDFHRILDDSIKKGFHFEGMTPQGLARHECTHALDDLIGNTRKGYVKNGKFVSLDGTISANAYNQSVASEILDAVRSERYDEWLTGYFDDVRYLGDYAMTSDKEMLAQCIAYETSGRTHPFSAAVKKRFDELYKEVLG